MKNNISLFKAYRWDELYQSVKETQYSPSVNIDKQQTLAIKSMLLAAWWSDKTNAKNIVSKYPLIINDHITYFFVTYTYICLADVTKIVHYMANPPKNLPKWMNIYLQLEVLGRTKRAKEQIIFLEKNTPKNKSLPDYIKMALYKSLDYDEADITYLKNYLIKHNVINDEDSLSKLLCIRCSLVSIDELDVGNSPFLLQKKARFLIYKNEPVESLKCYDTLAKTGFLDIDSVNTWLSIGISLPQARQYYKQRVKLAMSLVSGSLSIQASIASFAIIFAWIEGNYELAYNIIRQYKEFRLENNKFTKMNHIFFTYILRLYIEWQNNKETYQKVANTKELYVYGESHSLSLSNVNFLLDGQMTHVNTNFIQGIKMYHLSKPSSGHFANCLLEYIKFVKPNSDLLFTIGEIDTRPDEGIWNTHLKKEKELNTLIDDTVSGYIEFLSENLKDKNPASITIQGVPAPNYELKDKFDPGENKDGFLDMIRKVNKKMEELCLNKGYNFLDVYSATVGVDGKSNNKWHIDSFHLKPSFYTEADKWLIKPEVQEDPKPTAIDFSKHQTVSLSKPN
ncbi:hypothetical protein NG767_10785 [Aliarcobacter cryaerophilus]|uniref:hypothetical protein n=1 Tax=Aliarcobacter cryaerophilus TaxID=28198 RepID=UPI003DA32FDA